jgi:subtilisin family serine protease
MAKRKPTKTVLDGELSYMVRTAKRTATKRGDIPLDATAAKQLTIAEDVTVEPSERVTVKLISKPGLQSKLASWIKKKGGEITSQVEGGEVFLVNLPVTSIRNLDRAGYVQRAEAARVLLPRLDEARGDATRLDSALQSHPLTGDGVVFGIIDSGLDWIHPDFQDGNGHTRLELFTHAFVPPNSDISQFEDFETDAINDALSGQGQVPQGDPHGHGTHCASIAVGNGQESGGTFRGVAPNATIMAMRSEPLLDTHTIRGIREFFQHAGDRPAVVSLSLGGHIGAHDGTSAIENVIARESGPGRIVVVAAGNEGGDGIHWQGELVENDDITIPTRIADPNLQVVDVWIPRGDEVQIQIQAPDGSLFDPDGLVHSTVFGDFLADWREDSVNHDQNLTLLVAGNVNFTWQIRITAHRVLHGEVHAWGHTSSPSNANLLFPGFTDPGFSIGMPGTEERAIVVGSFVSKRQFETNQGTLLAQTLSVGQLSPFSSQGPTRIGKQKPDITAPGQYITAALANNSHFTNSPAYIPRHHPTAGYITIQGTSMATPFVAGVIALMLQRAPELTPEEIQQRLRITAQRDDDTGRVWDPGFGYGKIDVEALLNYVG